MSISKTTKADKSTKPDRPDGFPLFAHASGRWAKKVRGKLHYFGKWDDREAALNKWLEQKDDLLAGRTPRPKTEGLELRELVNGFLSHKLARVDTGELQRGTFAEYHAVAGMLVEAFGPRRRVDDITPADFGILRARLAETLGLETLGKRIQIVRSIFKYGYESTLVAVPVRFGPDFRKPSRKAMRRANADRPERVFTAEQIRKMLKLASPQLTAMILLGINAGFGNTDCAELPLSAVDFKAGMIAFPRPKTGAKRRVVLWPETAKALKVAVKARSEAIDSADAGLLFLTRQGRRWMRFQDGKKSERGTWVNSLGHEFTKLLKQAKIEAPGVGFYGLRHTFRTVADELQDRPAVDLVMGHVEDATDMRSHYVERINDDRLRRVVEHVRAWLFGTDKG